MIQFKKTEHDMLKKSIDDMFKQQDEYHFDQPLKRNLEEISLKAFDGDRLIGGIIARKQYQNIHITMLAVMNEYRNQKVE